MIPNLQLFLLLFFGLISQIYSIDYDEIQLEDAYETRSRILMVDGNVWLHAGKDKNITFKTFGNGRIYVDETDVSRLPNISSFSQLVGRVDNTNQMFLSMKSRQDTQTTAMRVVLNSAKHNLVALRNLTLEVIALKKWKNDKIARDMRRRGLLVRMTRQIIKINKVLAMNACEQNKCSNGGTCIPRIGTKFICLCPPHFTGETCEADIDECDVYNGTIAGCQNNGTCINKRGGFECQCQSGFHGPLCQYRMSACSKTYELCGAHGHCIENVLDPMIAASQDVPAYKCICDWGFKVSSDKNNPTCVDVNECDSNPCHPGVDCINLPGSFMCSGCPAGFKVEGNSCVDVDECQGEVRVCSPLVTCHNTVGDYYCDECPPGFSGDGKNCAKDDECANNKCHKLATCKTTDDSYSAVGGYNCYCPDGYVGDGIGEEGCKKSSTNVCQNSKCVNGAKCRATSDTDYQCDCEPGFLGKYCEKTSPCQTNPCMNGGTCVAVENIAYCDCPNHFFGRRCEEEEEHCGAHFTHPTGNYTFDMERSNKSSICDFIFEIPASNSAVKINFKSFDKFTQNGPGPTDCTTTEANLTLYDGSTDTSPEFATFCGDTNSVHAPLSDTPVTMTSTRAMLRFRGTQGTFSIVWETVVRNCGYRTSKPEGILSVPQNKQDVVCEWFISAPGGKVIEVTIPPIAMHSKDAEKCEQNSLEIYDGYSIYDGHRILETCASTQETQTLISTGPFISVSFISNMLPGVSGLESIRGFSINYKVVTPDRECGGELDNDASDFNFSGTIESPNFGSLYPPNMDCTWKINGTLGNGSYSGDMVLKLTFDEFDVKSSFSANGPLANYRSFRRYQPLISASGGLTRGMFNYRYLMDTGHCNNDYLKIHDGDGTMVHEGCNPRKPPNVLTVNNPVAVLNFHSDGANQGKGFRIQYEMSCQKRVSGNGTIQSWNFPNGGSAGKCTYYIDAPRTHVIHVKFLTIGLKVLPMSECFYTPKPVESYDNYIEFAGGRSDNIFFNRRYVCPRYPFVEGNWLSVSATRPLKITVASSGDPKFKGLSVEYKTEDVGCGGLFSSMTGTITSPNYPEKYLPHMHCVYQIFISWSKVVKLSFETFDLETTPATSCDYDRVEVYTTYHNETVHGDLLGKFCGAMIPPAIFSTANTMAVVFVSDRSVSGQGWNAKFEAVSRKTDCDLTMTAPGGNLVFDPQVNKYDRCTYHIAVHENQRVLIRMNNMTLPCDKSSLMFRNGPAETSPPFSSLPPESEVCTPKVNYMPVIRSFTNRVTIVFKSINSEGSFFNLTYETIASGCGGRVDGLSGVVSAPQYPLGDKRSQKCDWTLAVALGNKVRFALTAIDDFNSGDTQGFCPLFAQNRLDFLSSGRSGNLLLKRFCTREIASEPITSEDNELIIKYVQSGSLQTKKKLFGFSGHFTTLCTGIVLNAISGNIQNPGYPYMVYTNQYCHWTIRVPKGNRILVTMHNFSIKQNYKQNSCYGSMLKVEDTDLAEAEVTFDKTQYNTTTSVNKFCNNVVPRTIRSKHNTMKLTYNSLAPSTDQFWLSWTTLGCSRDISHPESLIVTKDHIDPEADFFECQYKIHAPVGKRINVIIEKLEILPINSDCVYKTEEEFEGLAVFMGSSNASGVPFQTLCKSVSQYNISSQTNELFLHISMNKNILMNNVFLNATVEFVDFPADSPADSCGRVIDLQPGIKNYIVSPGFPGPYPPGILCHWLVNAPPGYHIEFTIEEFHSPNYHDERLRSAARIIPPFGGSNFTCQWKLSFMDGMLSFFKGNKSLISNTVEKFCDESKEPKTFEVYESQTLVEFQGATNALGQKSGEAARERNGVQLSIKPACGGIVFADSKPQVISMHNDNFEVCNVTIRKRDPNDSEIWFRLEEHLKLNASDKHVDEDKIEIYVQGELRYIEGLHQTERTMIEYFADEEMMVSVQHASAPHTAVFVVSTDEKSCGGEVRHSQGILYNPTRKRDKPYDCAWKISNNIGNTVIVSIQDHNMMMSPNCTESYIEVRENNSSGKLLSRQCDNTNVDSKDFEAQSLYVVMRYRPEDGTPEEPSLDDVDYDRPLVKIKYEKVSGGRPKSRFVSNPMIDDVENMLWTLDAVDENVGILVKFSELYLPDPDSHLRFYKSAETDEVTTLEHEEVTGVMVPAEKFFDTNLVGVYGKLRKTDKFLFTWYPVPLNYKNLTAVQDEKAKKVYDCGGELSASYDWNYITSPLPAGQSFGYEENLHCRWTIERPMFTGIQLKFEYLDLENVENCSFDFVMFRLQFDNMPSEDGDIDLTNGFKHCALARSNGTFTFSVNRALHIHFVSDRSRHGVGFKLKYRLTCTSFEHITPGVFFERTIQSPNYDGSYPLREWKCQHSLIVESNRNLLVQIVDLDIEDNSPCSSNDVLILGNRYSEMQMGSNSYGDSSKYCGQLTQGENANFTSARGRLFIKYNAGPSTRKGFKILVKELFTECPSGILHLDENTPSRILQSPEYPKRIPNSVECEYIMAAPNGHRVMLTFDPDNFDIDENLDDCAALDYVEVRDGPSKHSQLIGVFCGNHPPSSIYSTGNFLYVRLHTSEYGRSLRFSAKFEIATCGGTVMIRENSTSRISSPNFPDPFTTPIQCQWTIRSVNTHMIEAKVDHIWLFYNQNCSIENLTVLDGNSTATPLLGPACVSRQVPETYTRSASNQLTVQFSSNSTSSRGGRQYCNDKKCGFELHMKLSEEKCGGTISDVEGTLKPPGYPGKLLPHVRCVWDFKTKPGFVYRFTINETDSDLYHSLHHLWRTGKEKCFPDVSVIEGYPPYKMLLSAENFCESKKTLMTTTDISRVVYDDTSTRDLIAKYGDSNSAEYANISFYAPFSISYLQIPANLNSQACSLLINRNTTLEFNPSGRDNSSTVSVHSLCHLSIEKPKNTGSVSVEISEYSTTQKSGTMSSMPTNYNERSCLPWDSNIKIISNEPVPIDQTVCASSMYEKNRTGLIFVNPNVDLFVSEMHVNDAQNFNLSVQFQDCGGVISTPNSGIITSPNFGTGQKYLAGSRCRWVLEAPEGQIVKVKFVEMRIVYDHECENDHLIVGEGRQADVNEIHRYCHKMDGEQEQKMEDRFKIVKSRGRYMTLQWITNDNFEDIGWKLEYEFLNENDSCGFHTRGMSGVIHTSLFGEEDYKNNLECVWDIQVPLGYHVNLKFTDFDVETADKCEKDQLVISQEHSTRATSPNGDYYFLFQDEEKETPLCGIEHPKDFDSESNRVRLNFTTDAKTTARGFRVNWSAQCGAVYRLNHGVVTSPDYPNGYPTTNMTCTYLIAPPDQNSVISIKFSDFDLSDFKTNYGRVPCEEDYLQIIEANTDRVVNTLCATQPMPEYALVFKGPIGLKFVSGNMFVWDMNEKKRKLNKGFSFAYSINKCGDNIELRENDHLITTITSPAFPLPYPQDLNCVWNITTDSDRELHVRFEELNLEDFTDCTADYVELFDSSELSANKSLGKFCGTMKKLPQYRLVSSGPNLLIHMKTDFNVNAGGFKLVVTSSLGAKAGCGGRLTATKEWKTLSSPQDEDGNYPPALMCGWTISGPVNSQLRIRFDNVDTEKLDYPPGIRPKPQCIDNLAVHDGQEFYSPLLAGDVCSSDSPLPKMLYSSHRHVFVTFETDRDGTGKGFNISYSIVNEECGGWLQATTDMKTLVYKGISKEENKEIDKERSHQRCRFMIQGPKTEPVMVSFKEFNIPSTASDCSDSYVEIRDVGSIQECHHPACAGEPNQRKITKLCGTHVPSYHVSNTNTIQIIVSAEIVPIGNHTRPSFKIEYEVLDSCNRTIDTNEIKSGRLTSPNFPKIYSENSSCSTVLNTSNQKILFAFNEFSLEDQNRVTQDCEFDYLRIREGDSNGTKFCGFDLPATFLTSGKDVSVDFKSDYSLAHAGYDLTYYTVFNELDNRIEFADSYELDGVVSNIGYPNGYNKSYSQVFTIRPPGSHDCSFIFSDMNIGLTKSRKECFQPTDEYLEIEVFFRGQLKNARIRDCTFANKKFNARELILEADTNERYIKLTFVSDGKSENDGRGFKIRWSCHSIGKTQAILP